MKAYIQVRDTAWDSFLSEEGPVLRMLNPEVAELRRLGHLVDGFWNGTAGFTVVNCIGSEAELDSFYNYFPPSDTLGYWKWSGNGKVDFATEYTGQHNDILPLHKDHVVLAEDGTEISRTPATFENPNWANDFAGLDQNRFARNYSREFGEEFA